MDQFKISHCATQFNADKEKSSIHEIMSWFQVEKKRGKSVVFHNFSWFIPGFLESSGGLVEFFSESLIPWNTMPHNSKNFLLSSLTGLFLDIAKGINCVATFTLFGTRNRWGKYLREQYGTRRYPWGIQRLVSTYSNSNGRGGGYSCQVKTQSAKIWPTFHFRWGGGLFCSSQNSKCQDLPKFQFSGILAKMSKNFAMPATFWKALHRR